MAKAIACALVLLLSASSSSAVTCVGWEASAAERHACCLRSHHTHASDQTAADDCCAHHEQGRQSEQATRVNTDVTVAVASAVLTPIDIRPTIADASTAAFGMPHLHPPGPISPPLRI